MSVILLLVSITLLAVVGTIRSAKSTEVVQLADTLNKAVSLEFNLSYLNLAVPIEEQRISLSAISLSDAVVKYVALDGAALGDDLLLRQLETLHYWFNELGSNPTSLDIARAQLGIQDANEVISDELSRAVAATNQDLVTLQIVFQWSLAIASLTTLAVMYLIGLLYVSIHGVMKWNSEVMTISTQSFPQRDLPRVRIWGGWLFPGAQQLAVDSAVISEEFALRANEEEQLLKKNQTLSRHLQKTVDDLNASRDEFKRNAQFAAVGRIAGKVSHEINNPVTGVLGYLAFIRKRNTDTELGTYLDKAIREVERIGRIAKSLLIFSRHSAAQPMAPFELGSTIDNVASLIDPQLHEASVKLIVQASGKIPTVIGRPDEFQQCLLNLLLNSRDALKTARTKNITISLARAGDFVDVAVVDSGAGVPAEVQEHLFHPFYTTKPAGEGNGLGLAVAFELMGRMGGKIDFDETHKPGAKFVLSVPIHNAGAAPGVEATGSDAAVDVAPVESEAITNIVTIDHHHAKG